jgi:hypothetical protein
MLALEGPFTSFGLIVNMQVSRQVKMLINLGDFSVKMFAQCRPR